MRFDAVIRNFTIIGEAVSRLPIEFKTKNKQLNWQQIKDYRNVIVHEYFGVDANITWDIIQNEIPELKIQIEALISKLNLKE